MHFESKFAFDKTIPVIKLKLPLLRRVPPNHLVTCSAVLMGFSLSKSVTQVSAMHTNSKMDDHLMPETEKTKLEPVTQLFQTTKKIRLKDRSEANFTRIEGTGTGYISENDLGSVVYVKESDGIEMTDVE